MQVNSTQNQVQITLGDKKNMTASSRTLKLYEFILTSQEKKQPGM